MSTFKTDLQTVKSQLTGREKVTFNFRISEEFGAKSIDNLSLSARAYHVLHRNHVETLNDVMDVWTSMNEFKNCGKTTVKDIHVAFVEFYYASLSDKQRAAFWKDAIKLSA